MNATSTKFIWWSGGFAIIPRRKRQAFGCYKGSVQVIEWLTFQWRVYNT